MIHQLAFELPPLENHSRADFIVTPANRLSVAAVEGWRDWPAGKMLLIGPEGAGKTHLAALWAEDVGARRIAALDLDKADLSLLAQAPLVIEDAHLIAGERARETPLFHLHNMLAGQHPLLITATATPRDWGLVVPDLLSRLQAAPLTRLSDPDDTLLFGVLTKLFADRQITPAPGLVAYLLPRMSRSICAARDLVAELDARALELQRPIGIRLAAFVLAQDLDLDWQDWEEDEVETPPEVTLPPEDETEWLALDDFLPEYLASHASRPA